MAATIESFVTPTHLYRYRGLSGPQRRARELSAIAQGYVWCATYKDLNDPMEGLYTTDVPTAREPWRTLRAGIRGGKDTQGIASFSESNDNELMWAHYAGGYRGMCVEYDFGPLREGLPDGITFCRLAYSDREYRLTDAGDADNVRAVLSTKSAKWNYEREWRMFGTVGRVRYVGFPITGVFIGSRTSAIAKRELRATVARMNIPTYEMSVRGYRIEFPEYGL